MRLIARKKNVYSEIKVLTSKKELFFSFTFPNFLFFREFFFKVVHFTPKRRRKKLFGLACFSCSTPYDDNQIYTVIIGDFSAFFLFFFWFFFGFFVLFFGPEKQKNLKKSRNSVSACFRTFWTTWGGCSDS